MKKKKQDKKVSYYAANGLTMYDPEQQLMANQGVSPDATDAGVVSPYAQEASFANGLQSLGGIEAGKLQQKKNKGKGIGKTIGSIVGGIGGAVVGTLVAPGVGTAAGLALGSQLGGSAGGGIGSVTGGGRFSDGLYEYGGQIPQYNTGGDVFGIQPLDPSTFNISTSYQNQTGMKTGKPFGMMPMEPEKTFTQNEVFYPWAPDSINAPKDKFDWKGIGNEALKIGMNALKHLNLPIGNTIAGGVAGLNALISNQKGRENSRRMRTPNNAYSMGNGSQALYENGGYVTRKRKQGNIQITEELPDFAEPIPDNYLSNRQFPVQVDRPQFQPIETNIPKVQRYDTTYNMFGEDPQYIPNYQGFDYRTALQNLQEEPDFIGNTSVVNSPDVYSEMTQNFRPNTQSYQWSPYSDEDQMGYFKDGGKVKKNPPIYTDNPKDPRIQAYQDSLYLYNSTKNDPSILNSSKSYKDWEKYTASWDSINPKAKAAYIRLNYPKEAKWTQRTFDDGLSGSTSVYERPKQPVVYQPLTQMNPSSLQELPVNVDPNIMQQAPEMRTPNPHYEQYTTYDGIGRPMRLPTLKQYENGGNIDGTGWIFSNSRPESRIEKVYNAIPGANNKYRDLESSDDVDDALRHAGTAMNITHSNPILNIIPGSTTMLGLAHEIANPNSFEEFSMDMANNMIGATVGQLPIPLSYKENVLDYMANREVLPTLDKKKNGGKMKGKKCKNGGIVEGSSYDMTNEEIENLINLGYEISFD